ncbi:hypothetical protein V492_03992 [Pseudogymnoascus sp. VKM F-4246]|nr:hypothetical protein V492_03992 [Pseudogymnoascus sp. VKM F-4246]
MHHQRLPRPGATSAVHFTNGTTVPIAAIEGNAAYKQQMRELVETAVAHNWTGTFQDPVPALSWPQYIQGLIGSMFLQSPPPSPLQSMLGILKTNTEVYLEHPIQFAEVSIPIWLDDHQAHTIDLALKQIGITHTTRSYRRAIRAASRHLGTDELSYCLSCKPRWVLSLDYSRSALGITVDEFERGIFETFYWSMRGDLGQDSIWNKTSDPHSLIGNTQYWEVLEEELKQALKAIGDGKLEDIVLLGDRITGNEDLLDILRKVLGAETFNNAISRHTALQKSGSMISPLFAAAMGQALLSDAIRDDTPDGCMYAGNCPGAKPYHGEL